MASAACKQPDSSDRRRPHDSSHSSKGNGSAAHVFAFHSAEFSEQFVRGQATDDWQVELAKDDQDLMFLASDLHREGSPGLKLVSGTDGDGAADLSIEDVLTKLAK